MTGTLTREDEEHLRLLAIGHYVVAAMQVLFGLFALIYVAMGLVFMLLPMKDTHNNPPPPFVGGIFIAFGVIWLLVACGVAACIVMAGRSLVRRRRRTFCMVVDAIMAMIFMPIGTFLGIFTIMVLMRPAVRDAFEGPPGELPAPGLR
jgi:hypothetical protein